MIGGLIGGGIASSKAGRTADLFFNVVGYDQSGKKTTLSFRFVNPKPANRLKMELPMFTGLAMGQSRSIEELRTAVAVGSQAGSTAPLPETLGPSSAPQQTKAGIPLPESLKPEGPELVLVGSTREDQWQAYLKQRGLEQWARNNPQLAQQLKQRLYPNP
ncbi:hypothetical protein [Synechococcus sp. CBW1108]|uniref:hypothetical protein n=1 Tax=Synechococcus sp. CBW1108 TaxID=1353147 RepID=UPI0018CDE8C5|nr:hypothetical protein [Synechococcus sp. CBW1108]QPN70005.1 hypothetical protein H8F27_16515 [Synechococcus sp. CBW1108]